MFYLTEGNEVAVFSQRGRHQKLGVITDGVRKARAVCVDAAGTLYVANYHHSVTIYPAGAVHPSMTLSSGLVHPMSVTVDAGGTVYVGDVNGQVVEYSAGQTVPSLVIPAQMNGSSKLGFPLAETIGPTGDLFVTYNFDGLSEVAEYAPGSTSPQYTGIAEPSGLGIVFDRFGRLVFGVESNPTQGSGIYIFDLNPVKFVRAFGDVNAPHALAFNAAGDRLYDADGALHRIYIYSYPKTALIDTLKVGSDSGVALNPHLPI